MSTVLVVGGAGYIGSHAARALRKRDFEALIYDNLSTGYAALVEGFELIEIHGITQPVSTQNLAGRDH